MGALTKYLQFCTITEQMFSMPNLELDLISPDVAQLILLFSAQPDLRFPDVDASKLHHAAARVKEVHAELAEAEAALQGVRTTLERENEALFKLAQRAHAYLKVFAETNERLTEQVEAISLPKPRRAAVVADPLNPAKKRGRPRKESSAQSLFGAEQEAVALA